MYAGIRAADTSGASTYLSCEAACYTEDSRSLYRIKISTRKQQAVPWQALNKKLREMSLGLAREYGVDFLPDVRAWAKYTNQRFPMEPNQTKASHEHTRTTHPNQHN